ncbi:hypothetical protein [Nocardioides caldifontis]|uniref:hypothetical protein n=1 Tax=Nocardioides caldifontis TaxID=2588938 RepID=UPI0011DF4767|nr:hypothetical protein [Nocardioides caldifontis]
MSVDELARRAGARLREEVATTTTAPVVEESLAALLATARRRARTRRTVEGLAAAATVASVVAGSLAGLYDGDDRPEPAEPVPSTCSNSALVRCTEDRQVTVDAPVGYGFTLLDGFADGVESTGAAEEVTVFSDRGRDGITFIVDATAAEDGVGRDAESLARWVAARPFLRTDLLPWDADGTAGWRVDVTLRKGKALAQARSCDGEGSGSPCHALITTPGVPFGESGPWPGMRSRYHFVDAPGGHTLVAWSWSFGKNPGPLDRNDALLGTLRFDAG